MFVLVMMTLCAAARGLGDAVDMDAVIDKSGIDGIGGIAVAVVALPAIEQRRHAIAYVKVVTGLTVTDGNRRKVVASLTTQFDIRCRIAEGNRRMRSLGKRTVAINVRAFFFCGAPRALAFRIVKRGKNDINLSVVMSRR